MHQLHHRALAASLAFCSSLAGCRSATPQHKDEAPPSPGAFSVSLTVKDLAASRAFYETLGFAVVRDEAQNNWLVLRNGTTTIGLFHGMFEENIMTFNPGWGPNATPLESFTDVRELQRRFEAAGLKLSMRADESSTGPAYFTLADPDGNQVLFDQHVPKPQ